MKEKIAELMAKEGFAEKLMECEEPEQVQALFAAEGIELSLDDVKAIGQALNAATAEGDELDEDSLDAVAGGSALDYIGPIVDACEAVYKAGRRAWRALRRFFRRW